MKTQSRDCGDAHTTHVLKLALAVTLFAAFLLEPAITMAKPSALGINGKIAFVRWFDCCSSDVFAINPEGTALANLTNDRGIDTSAAWSPDGSKIAFAKHYSYIYVMNVDGSNLKSLISFGGFDFGPYYLAWSPDGKRIAFTMGGFGYSAIMVMNANGSEPTIINHLSNLLGKPAWSPDMTRIAITAPGCVFVMNADGSGATCVASISSSGDNVAWSPDGSKLLYAGPGGLYLVNAAGGTPTKLTDGSNDYFAPVWSPDGTSIAFVTWRNRIPCALPGTTVCPEIYLMDADGSNQRPISNQPVLGIVNDWQPLAPKQILHPASATIQFSLPAYGAYENFGWVEIAVTRLGDLSGEASVDFATSGGTASPRSDYIPISAYVRFAPGEGEKKILIPIIDNVYVQGNRTVNLTLSNPQGAPFGFTSTSVLTIIDDDTSPPTSNPLDTSQFFVRQHYFDFLNRWPDQNGLNFWANQINSCGANANAACVETRRVNVSAAFFLSIEFQQTGFLVERIYKAAYGDANVTSTLGGAHQLAAPIIRFDEFLPDTQHIGQDLIVGQSGWETVLENNKQNFISEFVRRPRFTLAYPMFMTAVQFVDSLFANAGVVPSVLEREAAIREFNGAASSADNAARARALRRVAENQTLAQQEFNRAFVLMEYFGYMRRNPDGGQDRDYTGYDFWLTKLNQFSGDFQKSEMVKAFITSGEYRSRFGQP